MKSNKKVAWTTSAQKSVEKYTETIGPAITQSVPKYFLEGKNVDILPPELKSKHKKGYLKIEKMYNNHRKDYNFEVGDLVYIENGKRHNRKKLDALRIRPYKILNKISNSIYEVDVVLRAESYFYQILKLSIIYQIMPVMLYICDLISEKIENFSKYCYDNFTDFKNIGSVRARVQRSE